MESAKSLLACLLSPALRLLDPNEPICLLNLVGGFAVAGFFVLASSSSRNAQAVGAAARALFPKGALTSPSSLLDIRIYAINSVLSAAALNAWILGANRWRDWIASFTGAVFGEPYASTLPHWATRTAATVGLALAFEFGYYIAHWASHRVPALWRFHRMHHSANVLTPLTGVREHPVDTLLFGSLIGLSQGAFAALLAYPLGRGVDAYLILQTNVLIFGYALTLESLRHTHLWLPFTGLAGRVFQSPAHHQLHHSRDPAHYDSNFGFSLAIFDWLGGTLLMPKPHERPQFGLVDALPNPSVHDFYFGPLELSPAQLKASQDVDLSR
ncbi:MAG: sterol desaturase family protein [Methylocystis sp.]